MTRAEAMRNWCPLATVAQERPTHFGFTRLIAANREPDGDGHYACACRAHMCMLWREKAGGDGWCGLGGEVNHL